MKLSASIFVAIYLVFVIVGVVYSHPTKYPEEKKLFLEEFNFEDGQVPPFRSYHVHCMFQYHNNDSCTGLNNAMVLRQRFKTQFNIDDLNCQGDFDQGRLCMFPVALGPFGPFVAPEWAAFVPLEDLKLVAPWIMQNRGNFDCFIHPNSGFEREDHKEWGLWLGTPWKLDLSDPEFTEQLKKNVDCDCP